jgi:hypothetical protein
MIVLLVKTNIYFFNQKTTFSVFADKMQKCMNMNALSSFSFQPFFSFFHFSADEIDRVGGWPTAQQAMEMEEEKIKKKGTSVWFRSADPSLIRAL